jgi:hypothetical protein
VRNAGEYCEIIKNTGEWNIKNRGKILENTEECYRILSNTQENIEKY